MGGLFAELDGQGKVVADAQSEFLQTETSHEADVEDAMGLGARSQHATRWRSIGCYRPQGAIHAPSRERQRCDAKRPFDGQGSLDSEC